MPGGSAAVYNREVVVTLRKLLFLLFAAIYVVVCPLTILYGLGYLFTPGTAHTVVKTGLLDLSTAPPGASVDLDGLPYAETTPTVIRDLLPGTYTITLQLPGRLPWVHVAQVEAGKSTVFEHILLLPRAWSVRELTPDAFTDLIPLPGTGRFLLRRGPALDEHVVYDADEGDWWPIIPRGAPLGRATVRAWTMVSGSPTFLLDVTTGRDRRWLWVEPNATGAVVEDLTHLFMEPPRRVVWDLHDRRVLFTYQGHHLNRVDLDARAVRPYVAEQVVGVGLARHVVYVITNDGRLQRMDEEGRHVEPLTGEPLVLPGAPADDLRLDVGPANVFVVTGPRGALALGRPPAPLQVVVARGVRGLDLDPSGQRLLVWQRDRLGVVDLSPPASGDADETDGPPPVIWVVTGGRQIAQACWAAEGSSILFRDGHEVSLVQLTSDGPRPPEPLLRIRRASAFAYWDATGRLYYLDPASGRLAAIDLVPRAS